MNILDEELQDSANFWLDHYKQVGEKHYEDTPDWKIVELYFDKIVDRVLQDLPEMSDEENEKIIQRIGNLI